MLSVYTLYIEFSTLLDTLLVNIYIVELCI